MSNQIKFRVFDLADEVAVLVYRVIVGSPKENLYGLIF